MFYREALRTAAIEINVAVPDFQELKLLNYYIPL